MRNFLILKFIFSAFISNSQIDFEIYPVIEKTYLYNQTYFMYNSKVDTIYWYKLTNSSAKMIGKEKIEMSSFNGKVIYTKEHCYYKVSPRITNFHYKKIWIVNKNLKLRPYIRMCY
jgi:hypothetical protein